MRTLPVGLTTTCLHIPAEFRSLIRLALAVPLGEKEMVPAFVTMTPVCNGFVTRSAASLLTEYAAEPLEKTSWNPTFSAAARILI
jgi:hypothetical protein